MPAGQLRDRIEFQAREAIDDGMGNIVSGDWKVQFTRSANLRYRAGGEVFQETRLAGQQPLTITVRQTPDTRQITTEWRCRDVRRDVLFNIASPAMDPDGTRAWLEFMATAGVATP